MNKENLPLKKSPEIFKNRRRARPVDFASLLGFYSKNVRTSIKKHRHLGGFTKNWFVYILQCSDGTYYTGITVDLKKRLETHNVGKASKYTAARLPAKIVYSQKGYSESEAKKREAKIKAFSREEKVKLISGR